MSLQPDTLSLIPNQSVFVLTPSCCVLSTEAAKTNIIVFVLIGPALEPKIYSIGGGHAYHYPTYKVLSVLIHYPYSETTCLCAYSLMPHAQLRSNKYQFQSCNVAILEFITQKFVDVNMNMNPNSCEN
jgi:hypothetical protein